jgi:tetratricopeptide (TPR) repeat protein
VSYFKVLKLKKHIAGSLLIIVLSAAFMNVYSQNVQGRVTRQTAVESFTKGNYDEAFKEFSELLQIYSKDPLYKYYSAVCLIKMNKRSQDAVALLKQALQGAAIVKTLPPDALFYLGRAQQMSGNYTEALESFNSYTDQFGKKAAREQNVPEFIKQCNDSRGAIKESEVIPVINSETAKNEGDLKENKTPAKNLNRPSAIKDTSEITKLPLAYEKKVNEALDLQYKADSLNNLTIINRKELENTPNDKKQTLKAKISENETQVSLTQKSADRKYSEADKILNPVKEATLTQSAPQHLESKTVPDSSGMMDKNVNKPVTIQPDNNANKQLLKQSDNKLLKAPDKQSDTVKVSVQAEKKHAETFSFFGVNLKPDGVNKDKIIIDPEVPSGLIYRIQIAVFRNPVASSYFLGITPIYGFKIPGTDKTSYYAGMFRRSADAGKALGTVKSKGFKDSFIVAFLNNKRVSADRAALMEKEWGKRPFIDITKAESETPIDTVPPTLTLRVEVIKSLKPVKEDVFSDIEKLAGNRGLDLEPMDDGSISYLVGKFITFEDAEEYANLLIKNGYREAHVVAWLGQREIPLETAKQLFENMK